MDRVSRILGVKHDSTEPDNDRSESSFGKSTARYQRIASPSLARRGGGGTRVGR